MARERGMAVICARPMERKIRMINGFPVDVTPAPGRHYTRLTWPPRKQGKGESLISPRRIEAKFKARDAFTMYFEQGLSWEQIAKKLGYKSRSGPWMAVRRMTTRADHNRGYFDQ